VSTWIFIVAGLVAVGYYGTLWRTAGRADTRWLSLARKPTLKKNESCVAQFPSLWNGVMLTDRGVYISRMTQAPVFVPYAEIASARGGYILSDRDVGDSDPMWGLIVRTTSGAIHIARIWPGAGRAARLIDDSARRAQAGA
jgi:hypothetical protein